MKKEFNDITKLNLLEDCRIECIKADEWSHLFFSHIY
jgi:hypothetical protein